MVSLVAEKTLSSYETLHGTASCCVRFWEGGPTVAGVGVESHKKGLIRNWLIRPREILDITVIRMTIY